MISIRGRAWRGHQGEHRKWSLSENGLPNYMVESLRTESWSRGEGTAVKLQKSAPQENRSIRRKGCGRHEAVFHGGRFGFTSQGVRSEISYRNRYAARIPKQMTRMIPITNGQGNCLRLAVALSPGFSSSGSVGGSFGLVAMIVTSCRPATSAWVRRTFCLPSRLLGWPGKALRCSHRQKHLERKRGIRAF